MNSLRSSKDVKYFSLMELVIVVAVMAVISGGVIAAYDGMQASSAKGVSAKTIAELSSTIRNYTVINKTAPNNFDSLLAMAGAQTAESEAEATFLPEDLKEKLIVTSLDPAAIKSLIAAGITTVRHLNTEGNGDNLGTTELTTTLDANSQAAFVGNLRDIDIPNRAFDTPRTGSSAGSPKNRGRGFEHTLVAGATGADTSDLMLWEAGVGGEDNIKLGADANDQLIAFGIGNNCTLVGADRIGIDGAPTFADVAKNEYSRFIVLYNVGPVGDEFDTARLQAVLCTHGDYLEEDMGEYSGQL